MLRTLLLYINLAITTPLAATAVIIIGWFQSYSRWSFDNIVRPWCNIVLKITGIKVKMEGLENIEEDQSYILVSNHQSHADIPVLVVHMPLHMSIIAKKELFKIPFFGPGMRAIGIIEIDRSNRSRAVASLKQAEKIIRDEKLSILAFPEGTRSDDGQLLEFKKGPFVLAINTNLPILPVTVSGTRSILPKNTYLVKPGTVTVTIHPPVNVAEYDIGDRNQLINTVHNTISGGLYDNA